jgi:fructan beta-fructosidase
MLIRYFCFLFLLSSAEGYCQQKTYTEKYRPQFHFSPPSHWMNDPNGMVYYKGEYHLFYQYYPDSSVWGPMHWGHAVSRDLIHWEHLPVALYPDSLGYIFSGSVVVDEQNSSGFQRGPEKPMVAIFTYHDINGEKSGSLHFQTQGIAYSNDRGRTWKKYSGNPVLKNPGFKDFRDPKVFWYTAGKEWVMSLAVGDRIQFCHSGDLKNWDLCGEFGMHEGSHDGVWECPDLFPLQLGDGKQQKWVLLVSVGSGAPNGGSGTQYFTGDFDGKTFRNENPPQTILWVDYGSDDYAGVTWNNTGQRRLFLGWMSNWQYAQLVPTKPWRSSMTLPRELSLHETAEGIRLFAIPAKETAALRTNKKPVFLSKRTEMLPGLEEILLTIDLKQVKENNFGLEFSNSRQERLILGFDKIRNGFYIDRTAAGENSFSKGFGTMHFAPRTDTSDILKLDIFLDQSSVEFFADSGSIIMTDIFFPSQGYTLMQSYPSMEIGSFFQGEVYTLKAVWR